MAMIKVPAGKCFIKAWNSGKCTVYGNSWNSETGV